MRTAISHVDKNALFTRLHSNHTVFFFLASMTHGRLNKQYKTRLTGTSVKPLETHAIVQPAEKHKHGVLARQYSFKSCANTAIHFFYLLLCAVGSHVGAVTPCTQPNAFGRCFNTKRGAKITIGPPT